MGTIALGRELGDKGAVLDPITVEDGAHGLILGASGTGKTARDLIGWLLASTVAGEGLGRQSALVFDPESEAYLTSAEWLARSGYRVVLIDPFNRVAELVSRNPRVYDFLIRNRLTESVGFSPLRAGLDPESHNFYDDAAALAEDRIELSDHDHHFAPAAQGLDAGLIMLEKETRREHASLAAVRKLATEPDVFDRQTGKPTSGLAKTAANVVQRNKNLNEERDESPAAANSYDIMASLIGRFMNPTRETQSVAATVEVQTRWVLSRPMRDDMERPGFDFKTMKVTPTFCFVVMPFERLKTYRRWVRMLIGSALRALYEPGGLRVSFLLDEMPTACGNLPILADAYSVARKFNVQIVGFAQDLNQLRHYFGKQAESMMSASKFIQFFGANDLETAEWVSKRSGTIIDRLESASRTKATGADLLGGSRGEGSSESYRPRFRLEDVIGMPVGTGVVHRANTKDLIPFTAQFYDEDRVLRRRAGFNPFRQG